MEAGNMKGRRGGGGKQSEKGTGVVGGDECCSVCLEAVFVDAEERSVAKLKCGHFFHLDCIGSAYNAKGIMQCPNCRDIEDGQWLYANGCSLHDDIPFEDMAYDENLFDIDRLAEFIESQRVQQHIDQHVDPIGWCPYQGSYSQLSLPIGEIEIQASGYPGTIVTVLYGNAPSTCPFGPAHESRSSRYQPGYDYMVGALQYLQNDSVGREAGRQESLRYMHGESLGAAAEAARHQSSIHLDDVGLTGSMPVHERAPAYRVPNDIGVQQRSTVTNASSIWAEPNAHAHVQRGAGPVPPPSSLRSALGTSSRRWRNRVPSGVGRTGQANDSHAQLHWGVASSGGVQDAGIAIMPGTNWQGDQGIPWRRDEFSGYPWAVSEPESLRWTFAASSSSHTSTSHGAPGLGNGAFRTPSMIPGHSVFQCDGSEDVGLMHPHSSRRSR